MRNRRVIHLGVLSIGLTVSLPALATTYEVGAGQTYTKLSSLPALGPGDIVEIHAGTYNEVKRWTTSGTATNPITIRGLGSTRPVFDATGLIVDGALPNPRAVFQIEGANVIVENLEFKNARNGNNGAGVRVTGSAAVNDVIRNCYIHDNDMGIMSDGDDNLLIDGSEIALNGTAQYSGYSHNFYLGGQRTTVQFSYIHDSLFGQNVKSRGHYTELLYNYISDSQDGEVGLVDAAETAQANSNAVMIGNIVVSKPRGSAWNHGRFVWFGQDGGGAHNGTLYAVNNTFIAGDSRIYFLDANIAGASIVATNNVFVNSDTIAGGSGVGPVSGSNNWIPTTATNPAQFSGTVRGTSPGFVNAAGRDFHLLGTSTLINAGVSAPTSHDASGATKAAVPLFEYVLDLAHSARPSDGKLDIGAYEYGVAAGGSGTGGTGGTGTTGGTGGAPSSGGSAGSSAGGTANGGSNSGGHGAATGGSTASGGAIGSGGATSNGGTATSGAGGATAGAGTSSHDNGGCGCRVTSAPQSPLRDLLAVALLALGAGIRARRRTR